MRVDVDWPVLECPDGHRYHVHPDFGAFFIGSFHDRLQAAYVGALPPGRRRRLRRRPSCPGCGRSLPRAPTDSLDLDVLVDVLHTEPVRVRAGLPAYRCGECALPASWWGPQLESDLAEAVTASIQAAQIRNWPRFGKGGSPAR